MSYENWFLPGDEDLADRRIYCFPYAGGNPRAYLGWQRLLAGDAQLLAVGMPGRGHRAGEPRPGSIAELADGAASAILSTVDRPFVLFGHSLGALVAFEVARRLGDLPEFCHLIASGSAAPSLLPSARVLQAARLEGRAFAEAVSFFGGLPAEILAEEELRDLLLPGLRADFQLVAGYRYEPAAPLSVGVTLINGRDDPHVQPDRLEPWRRECKEPPRYQWVTGGHFYFERRPTAVTDTLRSLVSSTAEHDRDQHVELI